MFANSGKFDALPTGIIAVISLVGILTIGFSCYDFAQRYLISPSTSNAGQPLPDAHPAQEAISLETILNAPFFGRTDGSAFDAAARNAQPTSLYIELKGVIASPRNNESGAIIAEPGKPEKLYHSGDMVLDDTKLVAVFSDRVLLYRNKKYEVLNFRQDDMNTLPNATVKASPP